MVSLRVWTWGTSLYHATLITKTATVSGCTFNTAHPGVQVAYHEIIGTLLDYRPMRSGAWPKVAADFVYTMDRQSARDYQYNLRTKHLIVRHVARVYQHIT